MEVSIKSIGHNQGTSGWLKAEIGKGTIFFEEGISKNGNHGLWMKQTSGDKRRQMCVAIYGTYDNQEYEPMEIMLAPTDGNMDHQVQNIYSLTPSAAKAVNEIAQSWCDEENSERENDESLSVSVSFK